MTQTPATGRTTGRAAIVFFAALGGILFGYDLGIISGVLPFITLQFHLTDWEKGLVTASVSAGAVVGAICSTKVNDRIGRRRTIQLAAVIVVVGTIGAVTAPAAVMLTIARFVIGVAVGLSSSTVPAYLSELAPTRTRGALGALNQIFIVGGILIAFITSYLLGQWASDANWRWMLAGAAVPAIVLLVGLIGRPESPRWLLRNGREAEAVAVLRTMHGSDDAADDELAQLREVVALDAGARSRVRDLFGPMVRPMLFVAALLAAGQQLSGVNAINAYFPTMLISLGFATQAALLSGVLLGVSKLVFTAWVVFVVDRWGRKPLLLIGSITMAVTLAAAGLIASQVPDTGLRGTLMLIVIVLYLAGYELGWGAVVWVMMAEVFPLRERAVGMGVTAVVLWAFTGIVTAVFPVISADGALGLSGAMYLFAVINIVLFFIVRRRVPETRGRSLEQIELDLRRGRGTAPTAAGTRAASPRQAG